MDVTPGEGCVVLTKSKPTKGKGKPAKSIAKTTMKKDMRRMAKAVSKEVEAFRPDLQVCVCYGGIGVCYVTGGHAGSSGVGLAVLDPSIAPPLAVDRSDPGSQRLSIGSIPTHFDRTVVHICE